MIYLVILALAIFPLARAFNSTQPKLQKQFEHVQEAAVHEEEDTRRVEDAYAKEHGLDLEAVQARFAATGQLRCANGTGSASLVGNAGTIVTAAHMFFDKKSCTQINTTDQCSFVTVSRGVEISIPLGRTVDIGFGFKCPQLPDDDWAVVKLQRKALGIRPYNLPFGQVDVRRGKKIIAVNGRNADIFFLDKAGRKHLPKTIQHCTAGQNNYRDDRFSQFESTCASSEGTSGSAILLAMSFGDEFVGVTTGNLESAQASRAAIARGEPNKGVYRPGEWGSTHLPLSGRFLSAVKAAATIEPY